jgi:hypothetical protein
VKTLKASSGEPFPGDLERMETGKTNYRVPTTRITNYRGLFLKWLQNPHKYGERLVGDGQEKDFID